MERYAYNKRVFPFLHPSVSLSHLPVPAPAVSASLEALERPEQLVQDFSAFFNLERWGSTSMIPVFTVLARPVSAPSDVADIV